MVKRGFIGLFLLIILLLVLEFALALLGGGAAPDHPWMGKFDARLGWINGPGKSMVKLEGGGKEVEYVINSKHMRGPDTTADAGNDPVILALGGSTTLGLGVGANETYSARLGELINQRGLKVKVCNAGQMGYSLDQVYLWLQGYNRAARAREGRVGLFLLTIGQRDLLGLSLDNRAGRAKPLFPLESSVLKPGTPLPSLLPANLPLSAGGPPTKPWAIAKLLGFDGIPKGAAGSQLIPAEYCFFLRQEPPVVRECWGRASTILGLIGQEVKKAGGLLLVIPLPEHLQVSGAEAHRLADQLGVHIDKFFIDQTYNKIKSILEQLGLEYVDSLGFFREGKSRRRQLFSAASHRLTADGHALLARVVERQLVNLGWHGLPNKR